MKINSRFRVLNIYLRRKPAIAVAFERSRSLFCRVSQKRRSFLSEDDRIFPQSAIKGLENKYFRLCLALLFSLISQKYKILRLASNCISHSTFRISADVEKKGGKCSPDARKRVDFIRVDD